MNKQIYVSEDGVRFCIVDKTPIYFICKGIDMSIMNSISRFDMKNNKPVYMLFRKHAMIDTTCIKEYHLWRKSKAFALWTAILSRVGKNGYKKVGISKEWLHFSNFKRFYDENYHDGFVIDKDILSSPNHKMYSEETCCFIPSKLNTAVREFSTKRFRPHFKNGKYYFYISVIHNGEMVCADSLEQIIELYSVYRCIKVKTILSLHYFQIKEEVRKKIEEYYNINRYATELYKRVVQTQKG